jgi:hypothetical protein
MLKLLLSRQSRSSFAVATIAAVGVCLLFHMCYSESVNHLAIYNVTNKLLNHIIFKRFLVMTLGKFVCLLWGPFLAIWPVTFRRCPLAWRLAPMYRAFLYNLACSWAPAAQCWGRYDRKMAVSGFAESPKPRGEEGDLLGDQPVCRAHSRMGLRR